MNLKTHKYEVAIKALKANSNDKYFGDDETVKRKR